MMAPRVVSGVCVEEEGEKLRLALFRARLLLALHAREVQRRREVRLAAPVVVEQGKEHATLSLPPTENTMAVCSDSLRTMELEDDNTDAQHHHHHHHPQQQQQQQHEEVGGEELVVFRTTLLPPLHWSLPMREQRFEALEKRMQRRLKRTGHAERRSWFCGTRVVAAVCRAAEGDESRCSPRGDPFSAASSSSSSLTVTGNRSDGDSSQSTYAASHASADDVYIHELVRECESARTVSSPLNRPHHHCWSSMSATMCGASSQSPVRADTAAAASSENTALTTHMEFDRIGAGEAAPYTSYLFSPAVRIVDLRVLLASLKPNATNEKKSSVSATDAVLSSSSNSSTTGDGKSWESKSAAKQMSRHLGDGAASLHNRCTQVCFSPDGSCYLIGTRRGGVWFIPVDTRSIMVARISSPAATASAEPLLLQGHSGAVTDIAFNDVGTFFASAGVDACVILWNRHTRLKVRRINTEGGVPITVGFMPKNNNYLLVSLPQRHLLRMYNTSTGLPVTRKGPVIRVEATAVAMDPCADPFLFVGDVNGVITMWRYRASSSDTDGAASGSSDGGGTLTSIPIGGREKDLAKRKMRTNHSALPLPHGALVKSPAASTAAAAAAATARKEERRRPRQQVPSVIMEGQPQFEKVGELAVGKGIPVRAVVVSSMNHQQLCSLLRAQRAGQQLPEKSTIKRWAAAALSGVRQRDEYHTKLSSKNGNALSACALMLLVSIPCDRLMILCVQPSGSSPREYKLVPMLVVDHACRIRHMSAGTTAFCVDNTRCPTVSCACEEGFVHIIACTAARSLSAGSTESVGKAPALATTPWSVMATLPVPCGGIPCGLAWSPDMRHLVVVTEEGMLYHWQRVYLHHTDRHVHRNNSNDRDDDDDDNNSSPGPRILDEVDEWRMHFHREKERQLRRYRGEKQGARRGGGGDSLCESDIVWTSDEAPTNQS